MTVLGLVFWSQMSDHPLEDDTGAVALVKFILFGIIIAVALLTAGLLWHFRHDIKQAIQERPHKE